MYTPLTRYLSDFLNEIKKSRNPSDKWRVRVEKDGDETTELDNRRRRKVSP